MAFHSRSRRILFTADNGVCVEMYRPIAELLAPDPRLSLHHAAYLKHTRESFAKTQDAVSWLKSRGLPGRVHHYRVARWMPYDACVTPSFNDRLHAANARLKIQIFHGVSFKNYCIKDKALRYDRLYLPGEYHRRRYVESGLFKHDDPRLRVVGLPKLDRVVDGTFDRATVLRGLGLDPTLETVLFAPTGDRGNALAFWGERLIDELRSLPLNVIVKPHDHAHRDARGVDMRERLRTLESDRFRAVFESDVVPLLVAADLLVTDASSVAFEYALRDRPIVFMDVPEILSGPQAHRFDLATWGRRAGHIVTDPRDLPTEILRLLADPHEKSEVRRALARDVFHDPGNAARNAVNELYADLELAAAPVAIGSTGVGAGGAAPAPRRSPWIRASLAGAAAIGLFGVVLDCLDPDAVGVCAAAETQGIRGRDDNPDDLCIFVDQNGDGGSRVIMADQDFGLRVFDLAGNETQAIALGSQVHVDIRHGFVTAGGPITLVASVAGKGGRISFHQVEPGNGSLTRVPTQPCQTRVRPRGLCLHRAADGRISLFVVGERSGDGDYRLEQWSVEWSEGEVVCRFLRDRQVGGKCEGCVADDDLGAVFVAEERVGIWKYKTDPTDESPRVLIDRTGVAGQLRGDVEGLAILSTGHGEGYLIASSQGSDDLVAYRRGGGHEYVGRVEITGNDQVDAVTRPEGLDGVVADVGGMFRHGLLVVQDKDDDAGGENLKFVDWASVALAIHR